MDQPCQLTVAEVGRSSPAGLASFGSLQLPSVRTFYLSCRLTGEHVRVNCLHETNRDSLAIATVATGTPNPELRSTQPRGIPTIGIDMYGMTTGYSKAIWYVHRLLADSHCVTSTIGHAITTYSLSRLSMGQPGFVRRSGSNSNLRSSRSRSSGKDTVQRKSRPAAPLQGPAYPNAVVQNPGGRCISSSDLRREQAESVSCIKWHRNTTLLGTNRFYSEPYASGLLLSRRVPPRATMQRRR